MSAVTHRGSHHAWGTANKNQGFPRYSLKPNLLCPHGVRPRNKPRWDYSRCMVSSSKIQSALVDSPDTARARRMRKM